MEPTEASNQDTARSAEVREPHVLTLVDLTTWEERLLTDLDNVRGTIEDKARQLREKGTFAAYAALYRAYVEHISSSDDGTEALKRALFLQWVALSEPPFLTGLWELDPELEWRVLAEVQRRLVELALDRELVWMLHWYDNITGWYFERFADLSLLHQFLDITVPNLHLRGIFTKGSVANRGQMGRYWHSILTSQEQRRSHTS